MCLKKSDESSGLEGGELAVRTVTKIEPSVDRAVKKKLRVAAYCRVSTPSEAQLMSLEAQKEHYEEYITSNDDWEYAGIYYDEGISGTSKNKRHALQQMIKDCEDGKIDLILTKSLSRFARNVTDSLELTRKLTSLGVSILFEKEDINTGAMESELLLSIMSSVAESESVSNSENCKMGARYRFENGTFKLSSPPYGYDSVEGELVINEEEARWVRYMFSETLKGTSTHKIAESLNEKGVSGKRGSKWYASTVRGILRNEKYIGDCLFQKTYTDFTFKRKTNYGDYDQFYIPDHHDPIVSKEVFEAADKMLKQHAKEKNVKTGDPKYQNRYPFTGKIICGECGSGFKRRVNITGTKKYPAWVCKEHIENIDNCSMKFVKEEALEAAFVKMMNKLTFGRDEILLPLLKSIRGEAHKRNLLRINEIDTALEDMEERRQTLTMIMAKGYIDPPTFTQESNDLVAEATALQDEKDQLIKSINGGMKKTEELRELIKHTGKGVMETAFSKELFDRFVDHITVFSQNEFVFHLKCGLELRERI